MCKLKMDINFLLNEELAQLAACNVLCLYIFKHVCEAEFTKQPNIVPTQNSKSKSVHSNSFSPCSLLKGLMAIKS